MTHRLLPSVVAGLSLIALALSSSVQAAPPQRAHSFEGSCAITGDVVLDNSQSFVPRRSGFELDGEGRCQGTLDGRTLPQRGAPATLASGGPSPLHSCEAVYDKFTFALGLDPKGRPPVTILGSGQLVDVLRPQLALIRGQRSGIGTVLGMVQGHLEAIRRCAQGTFRKASVGLQIDTITPLVSNPG